MTHRYELVYVFDSALEEAQVNEKLDRHHELLKSADNAEPISKTNHWGTRTLAYPIDKNETGYYAVVDFDADPTLLAEFERSIKLDEGIIRYLLVLNEGELPVPPVIPERDEDDERHDRRGDRANTTEKTETPEKTATTEKTDTAEKTDTTETTETAEKPGSADASGKTETTDEGGAGEKTEAVEESAK